MEIECILKREGGTVASIDGVSYHFKPNANGAHVAEVKDNKHIARFLGIPEGYAIYEPAGGKKTAGKAAKAENKQEGAQTLVGSSVHPSEFEIYGTTYALGDVVAKAHAASGLSGDDWNALPDEERHSLIDDELDKLAAADVNGDGVVDGKDERAALAEAYAEKFGKKPHHKWSADKIRAELAAE